MSFVHISSSAEIGDDGTVLGLDRDTETVKKKKNGISDALATFLEVVSVNKSLLKRCDKSFFPFSSWAVAIRYHPHC